MKIIGIGASAGGLEPLRIILGVLSQDIDATIVIAQHLSPNHNSLLRDLLVRSTHLPVKDVINGQPLRQGEVYVTPPNHDIVVRDRCLYLEPPTVGPGPKPRINKFFESMAQDIKEDAVGIILSGTGSDGASGLESIRAAGGIGLVQALEDAQYDGMPRAAMDLGSVDRILSPIEIGHYINTLPALLASIDEPLASNSAINTLIGLVQRHTGVDLHRYRKQSLLRRIGRRMALQQINTLELYIQHCEQHPAELQALLQDIFIGVTQFFRDPTAFTALSNHLSAKLSYTQNNNTGGGGGATMKDEYRVWVAGCSTGEEAYSIAIMLEELFQKDALNLQYRIFATDISERSLQKARSGYYPTAALDAIDPDIIKRYFTYTQDGWQIARRVRDRVVFSVNDLGRDAPFSRMDLICCRNLLIYFTPEHQRYLLHTLHYALKPNGTLLLGSAESVSSVPGYFTPVDDMARIYTKDGESRAPRHNGLGRALIQPPSSVAPKSREVTVDPIAPLLARIALQRHKIAAIVINESNHLAHSIGDTSQYLAVTDGVGTLDLLALAVEALRAPLRIGIFQFRKNTTTPDATQIQIALNANTRVIASIAAFDIKRPGWLIITLQEEEIAIATLPMESELEGQTAKVLKLLESELSDARDSLQIVVQELEATNEELQAANEELQSANEEFQSTNEELQTTNEELRSTNEELLTVNEELNQKTMELTKLHSDFESVLTSLPTPPITGGCRPAYRIA